METRPLFVIGDLLANSFVAERMALIGDAAHAIVPFHGQGMNAAFEDCAELARLTQQGGTDWASLVADFEAARRNHAVGATHEVLMPEPRREIDRSRI